MAEPLPAWSLPAGGQAEIVLPVEWPERLTSEWAYGGADGAGVRVCVLDSGVTSAHPLVDVERTLKVTLDGTDARVEDDEEGDAFGHGTACAGIVHALA